MLWAILFESHPQAKTAFKADLAARKAGLVQSRPYVGRPGVSYHVWSIKSLNRLAQEMAPVVAATLAEKETFTVLLADEVAAIRFYGNDNLPEVIPASEIKRSVRYDITTTVNVLYSGWRHALAYDEMIENDLVFASTPKAGDMFAGVFE